MLTAPVASTSAAHENAPWKSEMEALRREIMNLTMSFRGRSRFHDVSLAGDVSVPLRDLSCPLIVRPGAGTTRNTARQLKTVVLLVRSIISRETVRPVCLSDGHYRSG